MGDGAVVYKVAPEVAEEELADLFAAAWSGGGAPSHAELEHSLAYICAYRDDRVVGFVSVAWNGGVHGFLLDTTVHPEVQRQGVGTELVKRAAAVAQKRGLVWLHVDFEPHLGEFYERCGFRPTAAGVMNLTNEEASVKPVEPS